MSRQRNDQPRPVPWSRLFWLGLPALLLAAPGATGNDYLNAIRTEILKLDENKPESRPAAKAENESAVQTEQGRLERDLKSELPGSYILYTKLNPEQQRQVASEYRASNDMGAVRERIVELFRNRN